MTKAEKRFHDLLCRHVGCAVCRFGRGIPDNDFVSIHHIVGRTKPGCEKLVLPLCGPDHQTGDLAFHKNKSRFVAAWGTERALLEKCKAFLCEMGYADAVEAVA